MAISMADMPKKKREAAPKPLTERISDKIYWALRTVIVLNIIALFFKIKYVITINIPEIVYALIFSFVCSFSSIFIFIMITHL